MAVALLAALIPLATSRSQDDGATESGANRLQLPVNEDQDNLLKGAEKAKKDGDFERTIDLLRAAVDKDLDSKRPNQIIFLDEQGAAAADQPALRRFLGVTESATALLRSLPKEAVALYRSKFDRHAQALFAAALDSDDLARELVKVCERFPLASGASGALQAAGDRAFARGELERARRLYERILRDYKDELKSPHAALVREKLILACIPLGRKQDVERLLKELTTEDKDAKVHVNGVAKSKDEVLALTLKQESLLRGEATDSRPLLTLPRGDTANRATFGRAIRVGTSRFKRAFDEGALDGGFRSMGSGGDPGPARHLPLVLNDSIFLATADRLRAFSLDGTERPKISIVGQAYTDDNPNVQFGAAIERGVLIAPFVDRVQDDQSFRGIPIKVKIPIRKLGGFDLERWRWRWNHRDVLATTPLKEASFPVAPVCCDGDCYVAAFKIEGFVNCYAVAFDAESGALRWSTWIASGQVEQTMFGEHAREPLCAPVCMGDGKVFDASQIGCVAALDADTGRIRWVKEYDTILVNAAKGYYPDPRNIIWQNNAPVYDQGVVVVAPMDSEYYYGLDAQDGKMLWRQSNSQHDVFDAHSQLGYLVGATDGRVVTAGGRRVVCQDIQTGARRWQVQLPDRHLVAGRGVIAAGKVYIPTSDTIEVINLATGTNEPSQAVPQMGGNLIVANDAVVIASDGKVAAFENKRTDKTTGKDF
jgi:outer membrane protein assembly factor BamB/tetratricopeptide (TPR) repeat protein